MRRSSSDTPPNTTAGMALVPPPSMLGSHAHLVGTPLVPYPHFYFVPVVPTQPFVGDMYGTGKPVTDIQALKSAIISVQPGEISRLLSSVSFTIGEKGYTSMIQTLGKAKEWRKALEVFDFVRVKAPWALNTYTYTTAIAACGISGQCLEAEQLFRIMREASKTNNNCAPNTVTYSALISAYSRAEDGISVDKVLALYDEMQQAHLQPDAITFSALISACERAGEPVHAVRMLDDAHERGFILQTPVYNSVLAALAAQGLSDRATEVFLGMQMVGVEPNRATYAALMLSYKNDGKWGAAVDLLRTMEQSPAAAPVRPDAELFALAVEASAEADQPDAALQLVETMLQRRLQLPGPAAASLVESCNRAGGFAPRLRALGLLPPLSSPGSPLSAAAEEAAALLEGLHVGGEGGNGNVGEQEEGEGGEEEEGEEAS